MRAEQMSDSGIDLKAFLAEQRHEGQLDSEGGFTIAAEKALQKLAYFALPQEFDWILKVVQAVNLWNVERLVVSQTRTATSFTFAPCPQPDPAALLNALSGAALDNANPIHALSMALRSLVEQVGLSFVLAFRDHGESGRPIYAGDDTTQLSPSTRSKWAHLKSDGIRLTVSHFRRRESFTGRYIPTIAKVPNRQREILKILEWNSAPSAVPIYLEQRLLNDPSRVPMMGFSPGFRVLRKAILVNDDGPRNLKFVGEDYPWNIRAREVKNSEPPARGNPWFILRTADWAQLHHFVHFDPMSQMKFSPYQVPNHRLLLTRQGVVCGSYTIRNSAWGTSVVLVAPADHYRSDLSGLGLEINDRENQGLINLRRHVVDALAEYREEFISILDWTPKPSARSSMTSYQENRAGFSIFTESLGKSVEWLTEAYRETKDRVWHLQLTERRRVVLLRRWRDFVLEDLERVILDLDRRPMQLDR